MDGAERGSSLVETLIATSIASILLGVLVQFAIVAQGTVGVQGEAVDVQQRVRVAAGALRNDLTMAGAGPSQGDWRGGLARVFAPIVPARIGSRNPDLELSHHADRISILYVDDTASQTTIRVAMGDAGAPLAIDDTAPGCPAGGTCGFAPGDRVLVFDPADASRAYDLVTVSDAGSGLLSHASGLSRPYGVGSRVLKAVQRVYYLDRSGHRLMVYDGDRSDMPVVDHVADLQFTYYAEPSSASVSPPAEEEGADCVHAAGSPPGSLLQDLGGLALKALTPAQLTDGPVCGVAPNRYDGDLLRVRRVRVTLRLEATAAIVGPPTPFGGHRSLLDEHVTFDVAPRNMGGDGYGPR